MTWVSTRRARHGLVWLVVLTVVALGRPSVQLSAQSPVAAAAKAGDRAAVRKLIAGRANVNALERDGSSALLWAVYNADLEMTRALLSAGAKPDIANRFGVTPLLQAASTGDTAIMEALLAARANPELAHPEGQTPLMAAARTGKVDAVKLLLAKGANVNASDEFMSQTPLMWAASEGHVEVVQTLLEAGATVNAKAKVSAISDRRHGDFPTGGFTPLMWAVRNGHDDVARELVKKGADLKATNGDNLTATMIAIINDRFDLASELIDLGSDPNDGSLYFAVDLHDGTTDMRARDGGLLRWDHPNKLTSLDLIKKLLDKGADPNKAFNGQTHSWGLGNGETHNGTPFYRAAVASDVEALKVLLAKGADMAWIPTAGGRGAGPRPSLIAASVGGRGYNFGGGPGFGRPGEAVWREPGSRKPVEAVEVMLKAGADPNVQLDDDGNTALHQAAQRNDLDMVRALVKNGASLEVYNWTGQTALNIAEENYEKSKDPNAPPDPAVLQAMQAGTALPTQKATPYQTVQLFRELLGWPALPPDTTPAAKPATTTASANQGN